jgi:hypothetical protein
MQRSKAVATLCVGEYRTGSRSDLVRLRQHATYRVTSRVLSLVERQREFLLKAGLLVKAYVQAALGSQSQLYKKIKGLKFSRSNKG